MKHYETLEHSSFDATISALGAATSAIARSYWRYWRRVFGDIGDCGVGITPQMCNRITNHGDMGTFFKPASRVFNIICILFYCGIYAMAIDVVTCRMIKKGCI